MDEFTLLDNIGKCDKKSVLEAFNKSVKSLRKMLRGGTYAIDSSIITTKPDFPGCGKTKRKIEKSGKSETPTEYEYLSGFKLFILYEVKSRIIVAMDIAPANESDHNYFLSVIKQGVHNCGKGKIKVIIADRGFLSGSHLWELKHKHGIDFIVPAKKGMIVRQDAIGLYKNYKDKPKAQWIYGKGVCTGYGVDDLKTYIDYNPADTKNNCNTNGSPINAVVVTTWKGEKVLAEDQVVLLTSISAEKDAALIAETYRLRSYIENCGFRELKQAAYLKLLPKRRGENTENVAYLHMMLCVFAHTLFYAFLSWRKRDVPKQADGDCLRAWRKQESIKEGNKILIVSEEKYYALFEIDEILDILGVHQKYRIQMNC